MTGALLVLAAVQRFALVVGVNQPSSDALKALRYADDDAVRTWELFRSAPGEAALLSVLDPDSQRVYPEAARAAEVPTRAGVLAAAQRLFERARAAKAAGDTAELYFVFSGHGSAGEGGEGALELADGRLTRRELYEKIVGPSPADVNHLVIDACDAYFVVHSRGEGDLDAELRERAREFLAKESLKSYPNTGALLSTSGAQESHEWSAIQAGVFSHLFRTALLGAADVDGDGRVSYLEVQAFVASASARIRHVKARMTVHARPPAKDLEHPLFEPRAAAGGVLVVDAAQSGRVSVEDERGLRYADFNKSAERELRLQLVGRGRYWVATSAGEYAVDGASEVHLAQAQLSEPRAGSRGGVAEALDKELFTVAFGPSFFEGWRARDVIENDARQPARPRPLRTAAWFTGGSALVSGALGAGFLWAASVSFEKYAQATTAEDLAAARGVTESRDQAANFFIGSTLALGITTGILLLSDSLGASE